MEAKVTDNLEPISTISDIEKEILSRETDNFTKKKIEIEISSNQS